MDPITGLPVPHTVIEGHKKTADLIYYDGPLLSLFRGEAGDQYLYYWCDSDELYNRWIVVRVTDKEVGSLLSNRITLRSILEKPADHYLFAVDIDDNIDIANIQLISPRELPKDYFPTNDWALDVAPLIQGRQNAQSKAYRIKLDGDLSLHDLGDIPRNYLRAYSFQYFIINSGQLPVEGLKKLFGTYPWRGGFSSMHFFNDLDKFVEKEHRPDLVAIQYASPGWIDINLLDTVAFAINNAINAYIQNTDEIKIVYKNIQRELGNRNLLSRDEEDRQVKKKSSKKRKLIETQYHNMTEEEFAIEAAGKMTRLLRIGPISELKEVAGKHLVALKVILSFYRKIKILADYQIEGKASY